VMVVLFGAGVTYFDFVRFRFHVPAKGSGAWALASPAPMMSTNTLKHVAERLTTFCIWASSIKR
jgi:hypothetical protein